MEKSRVGMEPHIEFHLLDKRLVWAIDLMGKKERVWCSTRSGRLLILSLIGLLILFSSSSTTTFPQALVSMSKRLRVGF